MHRNAECPSLDVPERLIDSRKGAHVDSAAAVESSAVEDRPMFLDQKRVLPDEVITELLDSGGDGVRSPFEDRLSPSVDALVGFDFEKTPTRRHEIRGEFRDLHRLDLADGRTPRRSHALTNARAFADTCSAPSPGRYSDDPRPNPAAPAARYSLMASGVMPPTGKKRVAGGNTLRNARSTFGASSSAGNSLSASAPWASAANPSVGVAIPGIHANPAAFAA